MPTRSEHLGREDRSRALAALLNGHGSFTDWEIVAIANQALHLVEAYLAGRDLPHLTHGARNRAVRAYVPAIALSYGNLQDLSRVARYDPVGRLTTADYEVALADFAIIEAESRPRL